MEVEPPWRSTGDPPADVGLSVVSDVDTAVIEIAVHGRWSRPLCLDVYHALRKSMAEHPSGIILDLHDLSDLDAASAGMWLAACRAANLLRPSVQVVLSMPPTRRLASHLRRLGAVRFLPIYATTKQARVEVVSRLPFIPRLHLSPLPPEPDSAAAAAADAVTVACAAWARLDLAGPGRQVVRELVTNAVIHAGTDIALTMSLRGSCLHLAVRDGDRRLPNLLDTGAADQGTTSTRRGVGLRMVDSRAYAWGAGPTRDGKVVWAMLQVLPGRTQRSG